MMTKRNVAGKPFFKTCIFMLFVFMLPAQMLLAQAEFKPWGNMDGIRIKGQLVEFNSRITVVGKSWLSVNSTDKERQKPKYIRNGNEQIVNTQIDSLQFTESVKDNGSGSVKITVKCVSREDTTVKGIYFNVSLPEAAYIGSMVKIGNGKEQPLDQSHPNNEGDYLHNQAKEISLTTSTQNISIKADTTLSITIRADTAGTKKRFIQLYFPICLGRINKGDVFEKSFEIKVSDKINNSPVTLKLDTSVQGRAFAGLGGNFRIQNPKTDPEVIDYCLKNLRVAWGRVEMPWISWQPDSAINPSIADTAKLNIRVRRSMEMAQRLNQMDIPVILTAWFPPAWAVVGTLHNGKSPDGVWGNPLNNTKTPLIYKSITDYLLYLKDHYGVEVKFFSFNESDLGINIRQTGAEHNELIKGLGAYFVSKGLKTKLLLGDNSDATTYKFIYPAINDAESHPFMGAVSFHSWRGWDTETLQKWTDAAKQTGLPLMVGEGSIDAAAWAYPAYFEESSYALEEINLYTRLLAICQPLSILQWQLTADYSPLKGGGIYGNNGPLEPTQRFWNLKQLASTPPNLFHMPLTANRNDLDISCAALGDNAKHIYTIHIVNNSASRQVHLTGLPNGVKEFKVYETNKDLDMKQLKSIKVSNHEAVFNLDSRCFTSLVSK
ncbi:MAG: hypothetical protein JWP37_2527 [Mucilaginibacter sp.]|nr:hypothetical protein [Mucilaginibacter sp.]